MMLMTIMNEQIYVGVWKDMDGGRKVFEAFV